MVVDSNIIIYYLKGKETLKPYLKEAFPVVSFISEMELLAFPKLDKSEEAAIKAILSRCIIEELREPLKELAIKVRKNYGLRLPDAIVAATALFYDLSLLTADKEFLKVEELDVVLYEP